MEQTIIKAWKYGKKTCKDTVILVQYGESYYVLGEEDAAKVRHCSQGIWLSILHEEIEMLSFWYSDLDVVLPKLIRKGYRVAIIEAKSMKGGEK